MAQKLTPTETVTLEELAISNMWEMEALVDLPPFVTPGPTKLIDVSLSE